MIIFFKAQTSSVLGSMFDYLATILLVEVFHFAYLLANLTGNICGGTVQFFLCRKWAFKAENGVMKVQAIKFVFVFAGNIILSAAGIYLFAHFFRINYVISKTITSIVLGVSYNYFMQKKYVFA